MRPGVAWECLQVLMDVAILPCSVVDLSLIMESSSRLWMMGSLPRYVKEMIDTARYCLMAE